jgi:3-oxoacyl-[acyl-carrier-protein] synthase-3
VALLATGILNNVEIKGIACAVPNNIKRSEEYYNIFGEESVRKFVNMTGVKKRHVALDEQCASDLCYAAATKLLSKLDWEPSSIDALVMITQTPDYAVPATACVLQHRLGLSENCIAFDVNLVAQPMYWGMARCYNVSPYVSRVLLLCEDYHKFGINQMTVQPP